MPPVTEGNLSRGFEYAIIDGPTLASKKPDLDTFNEQFQNASPGRREIIAFTNLCGNAELIAQLPLADPAAYTHIAAFMRADPKYQKHALFKIVATNYSEGTDTQRTPVA